MRTATALPLRAKSGSAENFAALLSCAMGPGLRPLSKQVWRWIWPDDSRSCLWQWIASDVGGS